MANRNKKKNSKPPDTWFNSCVETGEYSADPDIDVKYECMKLWELLDARDQIKIKIEGIEYKPRAKRKKNKEHS